MEMKRSNENDTIIDESHRAVNRSYHTAERYYNNSLKRKLEGMTQPHLCWTKLASFVFGSCSSSTPPLLTVDDCKPTDACVANGGYCIQSKKKEDCSGLFFPKECKSALCSCCVEDSKATTTTTSLGTTTSVTTTQTTTDTTTATVATDKETASSSPGETTATTAASEATSTSTSKETTTLVTTTQTTTTAPSTTATVATNKETASSSPGETTATTAASEATSISTSTETTALVTTTQTTTTAPSTTEVCNSNWIPHGNSCYFFSPIIDIADWNTAKKKCIDMKSNLTMITSDEEYTFLYDNVVDRGWIGMHSPYSNKTYLWIDGTTPAINNYICKHRLVTAKPN
ncbi:uncharacterized protein LOC135215325 [Macrobrachium nipponense]|uniref:uncharacterized protein LOC135215325 n=1 Tax=Macrobrachium nipponense TaxID=159736 RepID=UPI0030C82E8F